VLCVSKTAENIQKLREVRARRRGHGSLGDFIRMARQACETTGEPAGDTGKIVQGTDHPCAALPDVRLQLGGLQVLLDFDKAEALAGKPLEKGDAIGLRSLVPSTVPAASDGQDHRQARTGRQAPRRGFLLVHEVVHAELGEVHAAAAVFQPAEISIEGLFGQDEADLPGRAQKSLLYT
jgi:hypothetical protein